jgi:hypothetical protein
MAEFSKIKLRTKVKSSVQAEELNRREIIFGNYEKTVYIKDLSDNLLQFVPKDDTVVGNTNTWSSEQITEYVSVHSSDFDIIDGGTW